MTIVTKLPELRFLQKEDGKKILQYLELRESISVQELIWIDVPLVVDEKKEAS